MTNRAAQIVLEMMAFDELPESIRQRIAFHEIAINPVPVLADLQRYGEAKIITAFETGIEPGDLP